uniref:Uncharacterized protein n=1 Tax=Ditylenchus dipsaci TaxID=166011 RepID=A0A915DPP0_9BILA
MLNRFQIAILSVVVASLVAYHQYFTKVLSNDVSLPTFKVSFFVLVCFVVVQRWYFVFPYREWHFGHRLFWAAVLKSLVLSIASWMLSNPTVPPADGCMMLAAWLYVLVEASLDVLEEDFNANVNQARQDIVLFFNEETCKKFIVTSSLFVELVGPRIKVLNEALTDIVIEDLHTFLAPSCRRRPDIQRS